jgi:hypothetical protein
MYGTHDGGNGYNHGVKKDKSKAMDGFIYAPNELLKKSYLVLLLV